MSEEENKGVRSGFTIAFLRYGRVRAVSSPPSSAPGLSRLPWPDGAIPGTRRSPSANGERSPPLHPGRNTSPPSPTVSNGGRPGSPVVLQVPAAYQDADGVQTTVTLAPVLGPNDTTSFSVGPHDPSAPLVLDPVLGYSTYLGGNQLDTATGIAVDGAGNAVVTGTTSSANFPTTLGAFQTSGSGTDGFVTKFSAAGALLWSSRLGGGQTDKGNDVAVDLAGNVYVTGYTQSSNFPTCPY